jgi:hypothetical protein
MNEEFSSNIVIAPPCGFLEVHPHFVEFGQVLLILGPKRT